MHPSKLLASGVLLVLSTTSNAQSAVATAGGDASGSNGSVSFTVGQVDYISISNGSGVISQGVQQPYEIFQIIGVDEIKPEETIAVYPNPTNGLLQIRRDGSTSTTQLTIYDALGQLVESRLLNAAQSIIDLSGLSNGIYHLKFQNTSDQQAQLIQVIKTY